MANLEAIVSKKTENDTQWKARQQADRENLMALQDAGVLEITSSAEAYTRYRSCKVTIRHTVQAILRWRWCRMQT